MMNEILKKRIEEASEQSGALSFCPTPTVPGFLFSEIYNKLITYEL